MATVARLREVAKDVFEADDGRRIARENGATPNGNPLGGRWVLRSAEGLFLDFDQYRHDLAERNGLAFNYGRGPAGNQDGPMTEKQKAENFVVGQRVVCADPTRFLSDKCRYLTDREGLVERVWPSTGNPKTASRINQVLVRWKKRNGRGKEQTMVMGPTHLLPAQD